MKIKKDHQKELKKIEDCFQQLEVLSGQSGYVLDDLMGMQDFPDISVQKRNAAFNQALNRQQVFQISRRNTQKKEEEKVLAKLSGRR